jgi:branched-chain amino acid aminotransferase
VNYININGRLVACTDAIISYDNRAFRYGYGLFETILFREGRIELKELHWQRLFSGMEKLHFDIPMLITPEYFEEAMIRTVKKNKLEKLCRVRLQVYTGGGSLFDAIHKPEFIIECFELAPTIINLNENGLSVGLAIGLKKSADILSNLKTSNALIYSMAAQQAKTNKWSDALICNTEGNIIESSIANIFWIKDQIIYTPPLSSGCVAGVMRNFIISFLSISGIAVIEKNLPLNELLSADEVFLTNAIRRIKWIYTAGGSSFHKYDHIRHINKLLFIDK